MGTRGFLGFVIDGQEKITYNHWESYPESLGVKVLEWLRIAGVDGTEHIAERARALLVVDGDTTPTDEDIEQLQQYADQRVSTCSLKEWYVLLRTTQGNPAAILQAGVMEDASRFPLDSLWAEWGYLVDLDRQTFEVYRGFQEKPHSRGRFAERGGVDGYSPVALVAEWKISELPTTEDFLSAVR